MYRINRGLLSFCYESTAVIRSHRLPEILITFYLDFDIFGQNPEVVSAIIFFVVENNTYCRYVAIFSRSYTVYIFTVLSFQQIYFILKIQIIFVSLTKIQSYSNYLPVITVLA